MPTGTRTISCRAQWLGRMHYAPALALQEKYAAERHRNEGEDQLLLLEHEHVLTLGSKATDDHVLVDATQREVLGLELHPTTRGGDVTYHGPGQLVGYPILLLEESRRDAHHYLRDLEEVLILTLAEFGIEAGRHPSYTGVWVGDEKVAAIGVRLSRWVSSHGFALNVQPDMKYFDTIIPCGIQGKGVGSMSSILGHELEMSAVANTLTRHFGAVLGRRMHGELFPGRS